MAQGPQEPLPSFWKSTAGLAWLVAVAAGGFYLVTEHRAHLYGLLPYLALAACPLMHLFMHHGHHGHHGHHHGPDSRDGQGGPDERHRR